MNGEQKQPTFSIVVPTHNRPTQLASMLQALARLDYSHGCFEVIVVDDGRKMSLDNVRLLQGRIDRQVVSAISSSQLDF